MQPIQDLNVRALRPLISPCRLKDERPVSEAAVRTVAESREAVKRILAGDDRRLMVMVGPCSIHDPAAGMEYARRLAELARRVESQMLVLMRVYFEKPRTTVGWKGLINDPQLNGTFDIEGGLRLARQLLHDVADLGLPAATELLEPITPQYIADLLSMASIGARTTESPTHRQMASGLSMPVGYKNGTDGSLQVAIDAMQAARTSHNFLGIDQDGQTCIVATSGNPWAALILRGGRSGPNYSAEHLKFATERLAAANLSPRFLVDCSHANSNKDYRKQALVWNDVIDQRLGGNETIVGLMLESNLQPGNQPLGTDVSTLKYGVSITDGCIGWDETERLLLETYERLERQPASAAVRADGLAG